MTARDQILGRLRATPVGALPALPAVQDWFGAHARSESRAQQVLRLRSALETVHAEVHETSHAGWAALLLALGLGLARRRRWARRWLVLALSNYGAFGVLWTIGFARADFARQRIAFQAVLVVLLVGAAAWVMRWRRVRAAFDAPGAVPGKGQGGRIAENKPDGDDKSQD